MPQVFPLKEAPPREHGIEGGNRRGYIRYEAVTVSSPRFGGNEQQLLPVEVNEQVGGRHRCFKGTRARQSNHTQDILSYLGRYRFQLFNSFVIHLYHLKRRAAPAVNFSRTAAAASRRTVSSFSCQALSGLHPLPQHYSAYRSLKPSDHRHIRQAEFRPADRAPKMQPHANRSRRAFNGRRKLLEVPHSYYIADFYILQRPQSLNLRGILRGKGDAAHLAAVRLSGLAAPRGRLPRKIPVSWTHVKEDQRLFYRVFFRRKRHHEVRVSSRSCQVPPAIFSELSSRTLIYEQSGKSLARTARDAFGVKRSLQTDPQPISSAPSP